MRTRTQAKMAGIYVRISRDTEGTGLGVKRQEDDCRKLARKHGWAVHRVYRDNDLSAYSGRQRPGYEELLDDLKAGRVDTLVCWHQDRLTRAPRELEDLIDLIEDTGAMVATVTAGDFDLATPEGRLVARIVGSVARQESEHKSRRSRRKHEELARAGHVHGGGTRAFGFEPDAVTIRKAEAALIVDAARLVLAGESLRGICTEWNARGVSTVTGRPWRTIVLRRVLTAPRAAGLREHRGEVVGPADWPAIIDRATWHRLTALLNDPARTTWRPSRRYLLTGTARCSLCDAKLVARPRADHERCYVCATGNGSSGCGKIRVLAEPLEEFVVDMLLYRVSSPAVARAMVRVDRNADDAEVVATIAKYEAKLAELAQAWAADELSKPEWLAARDAVDARLQAARRQLATGGRTEVLGGLMGEPGAVKTEWGTASLDRRRAILATLVDRVTVAPAVKGRNRFDPDRVDVAWRV